MVKRSSSCLYDDSTIWHVQRRKKGSRKGKDCVSTLGKNTRKRREEKSTSWSCSNMQCCAPTKREFPWNHWRGGRYLFSFLLQLQRSFLTNARKDVTLGRKRKREGEGEEEKRIRNGFRDRFFLPFSFKRHTTMLRLLRFSQVLLLLLLHHRASYIRRESGFVERKQPERERRRRILSSRGGEGNLFGMFGPTLPMEMPDW